MKLCAFADEADKSVKGQIEALKRNGIKLIEVRGLDGVNVSKLTEKEAEKYAEMFRAAGIEVWSIGSPLGKIKLSDDLDAHMELTRHVCRLAKIFGTDKIRMFSFYEWEGKDDLVFSCLAEMVKIAEEEGVKLCHENEKKIYGDTCERTVRILDKVRGLGCVYDPANFLEVKEDSAMTLDALHGRADYFHIKDVISETGELVPAGYGDGRIGELVGRLPVDRDTVLTLEPHLKVFSGYSEFDESEMKNRFKFESNGEAFDAAVAALKKILLEAGYTETEGGFIK